MFIVSILLGTIAFSGYTSEYYDIEHTLDGTLEENIDGNIKTADEVYTFEERGSDAGYCGTHELSVSYSCSGTFAPACITFTVDDPLPDTVYSLLVEDTFNHTLVFEGEINGSQTVKFDRYGVEDVHITAEFPDGVKKTERLDGICIDGYEYNSFKWRFMTNQWSSIFGLINQYAGSINLGLSFKDYLQEKQYDSPRQWSNVSSLVRYYDPCVLSLANCLKNIMSGKTDLELVNCALKFVQSIGYADDMEQYGSAEYYAFPIETLWLQKGDCEDHAILFASIVKAMGFDVVMFFMKTSSGGHVAVGVDVGGASGTNFTYAGNSYFFCETTAIVGNFLTNLWNVGDMDTENTILYTTHIDRSRSSAAPV